MPDKNTNCLAGMRCPVSTCKSLGPFKIQVTTFVSVSDDGTEPPSGEYRPHGWRVCCECEDCGHSGTVKDFQITTQEIRKVRRAKPVNLPRFLGRMETEEGIKALEKRLKGK